MKPSVVIIINNLTTNKNLKSFKNLIFIDFWLINLIGFSIFVK